MKKELRKEIKGILKDFDWKSDEQTISECADMIISEIKQSA